MKHINNPLYQDTLMKTYMALKIQILQVKSTKDMEQKINGFLINYEYEEIHNITYKIDMFGRGIVIIEYFSLVDTIEKSNTEDLQ